MAIISENIVVAEVPTLNQLFEALRSILELQFVHLKDFKPQYRAFCDGEMRHSLANITKARTFAGLCAEPSYPHRTC
jgi:UDP-N-acetylglucosamine 4-epimerase